MIFQLGGHFLCRQHHHRAVVRQQGKDDNVTKQCQEDGELHQRKDSGEAHQVDQVADEGGAVEEDRAEKEAPEAVVVLQFLLQVAQLFHLSQQAEGPQLVKTGFSFIFSFVWFAKLL